MTSRAQKNNVLVEISNNSLKTTNLELFERAINARRNSYPALYAHQKNKRFKRLKFAMRQEEQRAIEELINYISYDGTVINAIGDCSKTTGLKNSTPGGPV